MPTTWITIDSLYSESLVQMIVLKCVWKFYMQKRSSKQKAKHCKRTVFLVYFFKFQWLNKQGHIYGETISECFPSRLGPKSVNVPVGCRKSFTCFPLPSVWLTCVVTTNAIKTSCYNIFHNYWAEKAVVTPGLNTHSVFHAVILKLKGRQNQMYPVLQVSSLLSTTGRQTDMAVWPWG